MVLGLGKSCIRLGNTIFSGSKLTKIERGDPIDFAIFSDAVKIIN